MAGDSFQNTDGRSVVDALVAVIVENRQYLSDIDGAIGDGDHGINMAKGFTMASERFEDGMSFSDALKVVGSVLMMEIGGSMGPLYGKFFRNLSKISKDAEHIDSEMFLNMLKSGYEAIIALGNAKPGDKTLVDTLDPAITAFEHALASQESFSSCLSAMESAAEAGKESTIDMVAHLGRAARLGERSRGVLDAGATSCWLILSSMAGSIRALLN